MVTHFSPFPTLSTERLCLRQILESDAPEIFIQRSDERILKFIGRPPALNLDDALEFIQKITAFLSAGESIIWGICLKANEGETTSQNRLIGTICLWNLQPDNAIAELGYLFHPDYWGQGFAAEALSSVIDFGFRIMGAAIIEAHVQTLNLASIKLLEKKGFVKTGKEENYLAYSLCAPPPHTIQIETARLSLREIAPKDAAFLLELLNSPGWLTNIGDRKVNNLEDARRYAIYRIAANYRKMGFGFYRMERKADGAAVGICGLVKRDFLEDVDLGYALLPQYFGQGYAFEAAAAILQFAKQKLNLPRIAAITIESNHSSIRVLEKLGLVFEQTIFAPNDEEPLMLFGKLL